MPYTRLKAKCLACHLHFVVYTWDRERHSRQTLHCPECGQHAANFLTWSDNDAGEISDEVPGTSAITPDFEMESISDIPIDQIVDD